MISKEHGDEKLKEEEWLILGDGDFSYSLDCAEYLVKRRSSATEFSSDNNYNNVNVHLICTGFDSIDDLKVKYKDIDSILTKLHGYNLISSMTPSLKKRRSTKSSTTNSDGNDDDDDNNNSVNNHHHHYVRITTEHGVDAIVLPSSYRNKSFRRIIFNHPHLGIEDAVLHHRFLCHMFYSLSSSLSFEDSANATTIHIGLVCLQFERWGCKRAAEMFGFEIMHKDKFQYPMGDNGQYETRRHQSGKSFGRRTHGSEMITFQKKDMGAGDDNIVTRLLPWQHISTNPTNKHYISLFSCSLCKKEFLEKRSLKNHMLSTHSIESKNKIDMPCPECKKNAIIRSFNSQNALKQHLIAKHQGTCTEIKPDWFKASISVTSVSEQRPKHKCPICLCEFFNIQDKLHHDRQFIPRNGDENSINSSLSCHVCQFCKKRFRDSRARLQHENYCSSHTTDINN